MEVPNEEQFRFHLAQTRELGCFLCRRRLYETMLVSETAIELGLVDDLRMFRNPILVGGGTPFLPPVTEDVPLGPGRDQDVRLARDLRALQARPR